MIARILRGQSLGLEAFEEAARTEPETQTLMQRVTVHEDPDATQAHPQRQLARAQIILVDETDLTGSFVLDAEGRAAWPTPAELTTKFLNVTARALDEPRVRALLRDVERLGDGGNPRVIGAILRKARARTFSKSASPPGAGDILSDRSF